MDAQKLGQLIRTLRTEKGLSQQQLADSLGVLAKTVSKWECGNGAPDLTLWETLSRVLGADLSQLLKGELKANRRESGRMDRISFY